MILFNNLNNGEITLFCGESPEPVVLDGVYLKNRSITILPNF